MAYLPENQYKKYYTNGNEYRLNLSKQPYVGNYIITSTGKVYAGTSPQNIIGKLFPLNEVLPNINKQPRNNKIYSILKPDLTRKQGSYTLIPSDQPSPTALEYAQGFFNRYLVIRLNTKSYFEISEDTFRNFKKRNYNRELHKIFFVKWSLSENNEEENFKTLRYLETKLPGILDFFPNKSQYAYKRGVINITPNSRIYPTGEVIPKGLPAAYQIGNDKINTINNPNVHKNQYFCNCVFNQNGQCNKWNARINKKYWCAAWEQLGSE